MDESLKADVMYWAAFYERRMRVGNKKIFHLEAWVVKVMSLHKVMCTFDLSAQERWGELPQLFPCHLLGLWRFTDHLHSFPWQHYFFEVDMDDLTLFD